MSFFGRSSLSIPQLTAANDLLAADTTPRVTVWVGATSGIGLATLEAFVSRGQPLRAYIVGRSAARQAPLLDGLRSRNARAEIRFVEGHVSLLSDVQRICDDIISAQKQQGDSSIDALFLSAGYVPLTGRQETSEGLERCLAVAYYSKVAFATLLMPLLKKAAHPRIVAVVAAGLETATGIELDDLDFSKRPKRFGPVAVAMQGATMVTLALDRIARDEPHVVVVHAHPGSVATGILSKAFDGAGKGVSQQLVRWIVEPVVSLGSFTPAQSGERSLYLLTSAAYGGWGTPTSGMRKDDGAINVDGKTMGGAVFLVDMQMRSIR